VRQADPDLVMQPDCVYIESNVSGTFHLLQAVRAH